MLPGVFSLRSLGGDGVWTWLFALAGPGASIRGARTCVDAAARGRGRCGDECVDDAHRHRLLSQQILSQLVLKSRGAPSKARRPQPVLRSHGARRKPCSAPSVPAVSRRGRARWAARAEGDRGRGRGKATRAAWNGEGEIPSSVDMRRVRGFHSGSPAVQGKCHAPQVRHRNIAHMKSELVA